MGCSNGKETLERPGSNTLTVYGNYFNAETRTIIACLQIAGIPFELEEVDHIRGDNLKEAYLKENPIG